MNLIPIKRYDNAFEANMAKALLDDNDIECFLQDENIMSVNPLYNIAIGGIKLMIDKENAETALELLDATNFNEADFMEEE